MPLQYKQLFVVLSKVVTPIILHPSLLHFNTLHAQNIYHPILYAYVSYTSFCAVCAQYAFKEKGMAFWIALAWCMHWMDPSRQILGDTLSSVYCFIKWRVRVWLVSHSFMGLNGHGLLYLMRQLGV